MVPCMPAAEGSPSGDHDNHSPFRRNPMGLRISLSSVFQNPVSLQIALRDPLISMCAFTRLLGTIWAAPALPLTERELRLYGSQVII